MGKKRINSPQTSTKKQPHVTKIQWKDISWRFSSCDRGGEWSWTKLDNPELYKEVMEKLHEFETKNWEEFKQSGSHPIELKDIEKTARDRLAAIKLDDIDSLVSLRVGAKRRIWCIKDQNIMKILWWDPKHEICPSPKKYT